MFIKYRELGLALIPLRKNEKKPIENNWTQFCERLPTEDECERWEGQGHVSFGLALGPASGLIAIDIDSDDARVLSACPPSPVRKRGRKGETRFFRYDPGVASCKVAGCIDVLSLNKQTVMPPSLHPETREPYVWLTPDTIENFDLSDLPVFTPGMLEDMRKELGESAPELPSGEGVPLQGPFTNDDPKRLCPHGSHDRLKRIANALIARGASPDEAIRELLRYDEENHLPTGYFKDPSRSDHFADPVSNALYFYASNLRTFNKRQTRSGQAPSVPLVSGSEIMDVSAVTTRAPEAFKPLDWPEPQGTLRDIRDLIAGLSVRHQPALAIGGAVAIAAAALSNKVRIGAVWPNVYVLNVANTGAGKSFPYETAKLLLSAENGLDLIGCGGYRSSSGILKDLMGRRERLDLIDECSSLFKTIRDGNVFQADIMDILNQLWSNSGSLFIGPESVGRERVSVWNACVSALMATTPDGIKTSISREFVSQGFIPRCLIFHDGEYGELKESAWDEALAQRIVAVLQSIQTMDGGKAAARNLLMPRANPFDIPVSVAAAKMIAHHARTSAERLAEPETEELERHFLSRVNQQARKLALIHGALRGTMVDELDVDWAIRTLVVAWHNASPILPQMNAENAQETNVMRVYEVIRKAGSITHSRLIGKTRFLRTNERHEILTSLESEGKIRSKTTDNRAKLWQIT